jgi:glycerol transport system substrate-binding protein
MRNLLLNTTACAAIMLATGSAHADMAAAEKFLAEEIGGLSVLSEDEQKAEMEFFINAAKPFAGMEIKVVSETIATHEYESKVLAPAFTAITGIKVTHDLIG